MAGLSGLSGLSGVNSVLGLEALFAVNKGGSNCEITV